MLKREACQNFPQTKVYKNDKYKILVVVGRGNIATITRIKSILNVTVLYVGNNS